MAKATRTIRIEGPDAAEGTARHELLEAYLSDPDTARHITEHDNYTPERFEAIECVITKIAQLRAEFPDLIVWTELRLTFPQTVLPPDDVGGTADVVAYSPGARRGWLLDFKNGVTDVDDPEVNDQLWFYATAAFWGSPIEQITLIIAQPNGIGVETIREYTAPAYRLAEFQADIQALLLACEAPDAHLVPGDWCTGCDVGSDCGAREREAIGALTGSPGTYQSLLIDEMPEPKDLNPARWAAIKEKATFVRSWLKAIDDAAYAHAVSGGNVPRFKMVQGEGRREWIGTPQEAAARLSAITGRPAAEYLRTTMCTLGDADADVKLAAKKSPDPDGVRKKASLLTAKTASGSLSLVPETDKRPAYNPATTAFAGVVPANLIEG